MKNKEIKQLAASAIDDKIIDLLANLLKLRLCKQVGRVEKPHEMKLIRRSVSRLITEKRARKHTISKIIP